MKRRFTEEKILAILREGEIAPTVAESCREHEISEWTYHRWQRQYRVMSRQDTVGEIQIRSR